MGREGGAGGARGSSVAKSRLRDERERERGREREREGERLGRRERSRTARRKARESEGRAREVSHCATKTGGWARRHRTARERNEREERRREREKPHHTAWEGGDGETEGEDSTAESQVSARGTKTCIPKHLRHKYISTVLGEADETGYKRRGSKASEGGLLKQGCTAKYTRKRKE